MHQWKNFLKAVEKGLNNSYKLVISHELYLSRHKKHVISRLTENTKEWQALSEPVCAFWSGQIKFSCKNSEDPNQLASDEASSCQIMIHTVFHSVYMNPCQQMEFCH